MTKEEKLLIIKLRKEGYGYKKIAGEIPTVPMSTIRYLCSKTNEDEIISFCECCGKEINVAPKKKKARFCSDKCRFKWWQDYRKNHQVKGMIKVKCESCGVEFITYPSKKRHYCSRDCYLKRNAKVGVSND